MAAAGDVIVKAGSNRFARAGRQETQGALYVFEKYAERKRFFDAKDAQKSMAAGLNVLGSVAIGQAG
jgi:hypothetical protein